MRVWRVAHESAQFEGVPAGPYACGAELPEGVAAKLHRMFEEHCDHEHPSPFHPDSGLRGINPNERCGFDSREALSDWFEGFLPLLAECGFRVYTYDAPDFACRVGFAGQTVFDKYEATELTAEPFALKPQQIALFA